MENKMQEMNKYIKSCIEDLSNIICTTAICKACLDNVQKLNTKTALDFIIPESINHDDQEAVNSYLSSVSDYITTDDNGNFNGMDIKNFCQKAADVGLMAFDKTNRRYKIVDGKTMQDFVKELNLSLPFLQVMFGEIEETWAEFDQREVKDMNEYGKNWKYTLIKKVAEKTKMNEGYIEKTVNKIFDRIRKDEDTRAILRGNEIDPDKSMNEILQNIYNVWKKAERDDKAYLAEKIAGVRSLNVFCALMNTFDNTEEADEAVETSAKPKERVHLGRLVLQCANDDGLTVPDWDFILKGISIIDEVTLKGLVSDASAVIRAVSEKLKAHDVLCGRMTVEVTV